MKKTFLLLAGLAVAAIAMAQGTSSINGTVTDSSGALIAGAKVEAKNEGTGVTFTTVTTQTGNYSFPSIALGSYTITVQQTGFSTAISVHNELTVGTPLVIDVALKVGKVTESVQVESSYARLETSNAMVSDVMDTKQVQELPLNGRNPLSLLTLEPGVVQRTFQSAGSGTHVFGSRDRAHNVTVDGIDANESTVPNPQSNIQRLNPDNVQEFRTITLGATAENGRNSGANVMVATKSGSNGFHGAAYYFNRNAAYNANDFFNNANGIKRPDLKLNQGGFDVGGPIFKNRTFFFASFQGNSIKQTAPISSALGSVPATYTNAARTGIFRFVRGRVTASNGTSFTQNSPLMVDSAGNLLPGINACTSGNNQNCVDSYNIFANDPLGKGADPATIALIRSLPAPNTFAGVGDGLNTGGYLWNAPTKFTGPHVSVRVDHTFGPNDNVFVRWLQNRFDTKDGDFVNARPQVYPGFPPLGEVSRLGRNLAMSYRHTFSPQMVNELTAGFNRFAFAFTFGESNPGFGDPTKNPPWADSCIYGSFVNITGPYCASPHTQRAVTTPQIIDNLTWSHGAHTVRAGINFRFYEHNDSRGFFGSTILAPGVTFSQSGRGNFGAYNIPTGSGASLPSSTDIGNLQEAIVEMLGIPYTVQQSYRADFASNKYVSAQYATVYTRAHQYDSFIQDEWKIRPNVTINAGLRWEFNPAPYDKQQSLVPDKPLDGSQGIVTFKPSDRWFQNNNVGSIGPRLGVAWSPDNKTSVRAGYSLLFDTISTFQVTAIAGKMPGFMLGCVTSTDGTGAIQTSNGCVTPAGTTNRISAGFPLGIAAPTITPSAALSPIPQTSSAAPAIGAFDQNMKNPAVHEWSLTIQRQLPMNTVVEIGYVGKRGTHLQRAYDLNQGLINQPGFLDSFNIARANELAGCSTFDGSSSTGCAAGYVPLKPTLINSMVSATFTNSSTSKTDLQRGNIGNFLTRMDALALTSSQRINVPLNYVRPNAQFGQIFYQDSGGDSYYHGAYLSARHRFEKGLDFGFSWTYSKSIDALSVDPTGASTSGGLSTTSFSRTPTDARNFALDRAVSDFDNRNVVLTNALYELPIGKGKAFARNAPRWLDEIIGGWQLTGIYSFQSGEPFTFNSNARTSNAGHVSTALIVGPNIPGGPLQNNAPGVVGPVEFQTNGFITTLGDPHLNCNQVTGTQTYFCIPPPGQNGSGRNLQRGPHVWNLDAGILKNFAVTERLKLQFRGEVFNALNHPNFESVRNATSGSTAVTSTLFGQVCCATAALASSQNVNPVGESYRVIQLGLKVIF